MLWVPQNFASADSNGKRVLRRAAPLTFGMFGATGNDDAIEFKEAGSGVLTHPLSGLTAKHVGDYLVKSLEQRDSVPKYKFVTRHSSTLFQHLNPLEEKEPRHSIWHVTHSWSSPITDIAVLQIAAGDGPHHEPVGYFPWRLLPPPVGAKVYLLGFPKFDVASISETDFGIESELTFQPATVIAIHELRRPDGAPRHPCFEVDQKVDAGFSGGPVIYDDSLCGIVASSTSRNAHGVRRSGPSLFLSMRMTSLATPLESAICSLQT